MEPFIPIVITQALDALGNLALIFMSPAVIWTTIKMVRMDTVFGLHLVNTKEKFKELTDDVGEHHDKIHDLQMDVSSLMSGRRKNNTNL